MANPIDLVHGISVGRGYVWSRHCPGVVSLWTIFGTHLMWPVGPLPSVVQSVGHARTQNEARILNERQVTYQSARVMVEWDNAGCDKGGLWLPDWCPSPRRR